MSVTGLEEIRRFSIFRRVERSRSRRGPIVPVANCKAFLRTYSDELEAFELAILDAISASAKQNATSNGKRRIYHPREDQTFLLSREFPVMDYSRRHLYFPLEINYLMSGILTVDLLIEERGLMKSTNFEIRNFIEKENYCFAIRMNF